MLNLIQQQVNRILTSPEFKATDVQKSFLTFVVETALAGRSHEIKGYTVATQVFGRGEEFNQATDPIVSIQANKLRRALERYYLVAGQNDPCPHRDPQRHLCAAVSGNQPPRWDAAIQRKTKE
jgi:adenylate cyclase